MSTMPKTPEITPGQIEQFHAAASDPIADEPHCCLATSSADGGTNARAVRSFGGAAGGDPWTRRFLVRRGARKVAEMRAAPLVTLAYQHPSGDAYVALNGLANLIEDNAEMRTLWPSTWMRNSRLASPTRT